MNTNTNSVSKSSSITCPTYFKYGIPVTLAVTSALYYGYKWFMAKNAKPEKPDFDEQVLFTNDKMTVVAQTASAFNSPVAKPDIPKDVVPETTSANH